jgi:chromosomal replication initiator protein
VNAELAHIWTRVQRELALTLEEPTYRMWLEPLQPLQLTDTLLLVQAPAHSCRWIADRFGALLQHAVATVLGPDVAVQLTGDAGRDERRGHASPSRSSLPPDAASTQHAAQTHTQLLPHAANPKHTFEQFVIGDSNRLAHAAALTVAEMPAQAYNPLFICGPPGVGKTHLLNSIASLLLAHNPGLTVRCTTGEAFTNDFLAALSRGHTDAFKARFRHVDVLLMDDVEFLQRKAKTEEELFHTFNALHDGGRQIVLTSDRTPRDLQGLEERLRERFQAGLVADITPPDFPTRLAILRMRAHLDGVELSSELALHAIADRVSHNVRALEGALIRVVAFSSLTGRPLTPELTNEVLNRLYPQQPTDPPRTSSVAEIQRVACEHFGLSREELLSTTRSPRIAWPRQIAMYLARELTSESLPSIGRHFGGRDHTTVLHACRRASTRIATDESSRELIELLRRRLDPHTPAPADQHLDRHS